MYCDTSARKAVVHNYDAVREGREMDIVTYCFRWIVLRHLGIKLRKQG